MIKINIKKEGGLGIALTINFLKTLIPTRNFRISIKKDKIIATLFLPWNLLKKHAEVYS